MTKKKKKKKIIATEIRRIISDVSSENGNFSISNFKVLDKLLPF